MEKILLSTPHMSGEEQKYIQQAFETNWIAPLGDNVNQFEQDIIDYTGATATAAVSSGTAAIHLALELLGVGPDDTVICSSLTFVASVNPVLYQGAAPVFIDSEPGSWNMSPRALEQALIEAAEQDKLPKAVVVVHLYGQSADMNPILELSSRYGVAVIEDAAESLGATYKGKLTGSMGDFGIFSFNGNKIVTTSGGGMLVSNNEEAINRARHLATQAREPVPHYQHEVAGYNYRLSNVLAGIGRGQMEVIEERVQARRVVFKRYEKELGHLPGIEFMPEMDYGRSNRWLTALTIEPEIAGIGRNELIEALERANIEARPVWKPMHMQPLFEGAKYYKHGEHCVAEELFEKGLCLPSGSNLTAEQQTYVIETVKRVFQKSGVKA
ncbi:aminotransferase class I/II-fold pyridoxal phosphate-dependent enzyme [Salsuginibacillus kocurii]|uniref:DegT/DnrJ/EryC1/StrS family aminotransferase n=1 Tax=Salsuginibacillus kocurii TaxID=427078 RepID=UPI00036DE71C